MCVLGCNGSAPPSLPVLLWLGPELDEQLLELVAIGHARHRVEQKVDGKRGVEHTVAYLLDVRLDRIVVLAFGEQDANVDVDVERVDGQIEEQEGAREHDEHLGHFARHRVRLRVDDDRAAAAVDALLVAEHERGARFAGARASQSALQRCDRQRRLLVDRHARVARHVHSSHAWTTTSTATNTATGASSRWVCLRWQVGESVLFAGHATATTNSVFVGVFRFGRARITQLNRFKKGALNYNIQIHIYFK